MTNDDLKEKMLAFIETRILRRPQMTDDDLKEKMLAFIETRDGDYFDEWYASPRDFAATVLSDFAEHLGIELVVPEYIPRKTKPQVDREALLKALLPGIHNLFDIEFKKMEAKLQEEWDKQGDVE